MQNFYIRCFFMKVHIFLRKILQYSKKSLNELGKDEILPWLPLPLVEFLIQNLIKLLTFLNLELDCQQFGFFSKNQNVFSIDSDKNFIESLFVGDLENIIRIF